MVHKQDIYVIVPAYNESRFIGRFLDKLAKVTTNIVVVDDGSSDKTCSIVRGKGVECLSHLTNLGKGAALKTGCEYAFKKKNADAVVIMDGDDQHEVEDLKNFTKEIKKGKQIILGVRNLDAKMPLMRVLGNKFMSILINLLFGQYISDIPSGFKAFTKSAYYKLRWQSPGYEVEAEIAVRIAKNKLKFTEIPISTVYYDKEYGFNLIDAIRLLVRIPMWLWS